MTAPFRRSIGGESSRMGASSETHFLAVTPAGLGLTLGKESGRVEMVSGHWLGCVENGACLIDQCDRNPTTAGVRVETKRSLRQATTSSGRGCHSSVPPAEVAHNEAPLEPVLLSPCSTKMAGPVAGDLRRPTRAFAFFRGPNPRTALGGQDVAGARRPRPISRFLAQTQRPRSGGDPSRKDAPLRGIQRLLRRRPAQRGVRLRVPGPKGPPTSISTRRCARS